ncbi:MAG: hypothetical protein IKO27_05900 [Ruminococcus sp.]|nr:hypothetical protein [Ruminococcus sp.]
MRIIKYIIVTVLAAVLLAGCGDSENNTSAHYEVVLRTLTQSVRTDDTEAYLLCFTDAARAVYEKSPGFDRKLAGKLAVTEDGVRLGLICSVADHRELERDEIAALRDAYSEKYSRRLEITKAYELKLEFSSGRSEAKRTVNVINDGTNWLIMGPVIESIFTDSSSSESSGSSSN